MKKLIEITTTVDNAGHAEDTIAGRRAVPGCLLCYAKASKQSQPEAIDQVVSLHLFKETGSSPQAGQRYVWLPEDMVAALAQSSMAAASQEAIFSEELFVSHTMQDDHQAAKSGHVFLGVGHSNGPGEVHVFGKP